jgi:hypothetical protein
MLYMRLLQLRPVFDLMFGQESERGGVAFVAGLLVSRGRCSGVDVESRPLIRDSSIFLERVLWSLERLAHLEKVFYPLEKDSRY